MVIELMSVGPAYRIKVKGKTELYLTGHVVEKSKKAIKFRTERNEEFILQDEELSWAKRNDGDENEQ